MQEDIMGKPHRSKIIRVQRRRLVPPHARQREVAHNHGLERRHMATIGSGGGSTTSPINFGHQRR